MFQRRRNAYKVLFCIILTEKEAFLFTLVHKKYTYRNGKKYGPYLYENKRMDGRVVTSYLGKERRRNRRYSLIYLFGCLLLLFLLGFVFYIQSGGFDLFLSPYSQGELIVGEFSFSIGGEEVVLSDAKVKVRLANEEEIYHEKNFFLSDVSLINYPEIEFDLQIFLIGKGEGESEKIQNEKEEGTPLSPEETTQVVHGIVTADENYGYVFEQGEVGAELISNSVNVNGVKIGSDVLRINEEENKIIVSTDYVVGSKINIDIEKFGFVVPGKDSVLYIEVVSSGGEVIAKEERDILVGEVAEESEEEIVEIPEEQKIKFGEPVVWTKEIVVSGQQRITFELPAKAELVSVNEIELSSGEGVPPSRPEEVVLSPSGNQVFEYEITKEGIDKLIIKYSTPPVTKTFEEETERGMRVMFSAPDIEMQGHEYKNVEVFVEIPEKFSDRAGNTRIYWENEEKFVSVISVDSSLIKWIVPHLSNQTFEIIFITKAEHLDENRIFLEDVFEEVKERDDVWVEIPENHYIRIWFEENLTSDKDITIYARGDGNASVEVYEKDSEEKIADFGIISEDGEYKIFLDNLVGEQDVFDLKVVNGIVKFDYIVDPPRDAEPISSCGFSAWQEGEYYYLTQHLSTGSGACLSIIDVNNIIVDGMGFSISGELEGTEGFDVGGITIVSGITLKNFVFYDLGIAINFFARESVIENVKMQGNDIGLFIDGFYNNPLVNNRVIDSSINSNNFDVFLTWYSQNNVFLNVSYDIEESVDSESSLVRKWHYQAYANDTEGNPLDGANIKVYDSAENLQFNLASDETGYTEANELLDYINTGGVRDVQLPYAVYADYLGEQLQVRVNNVNEEQNIMDVFTFDLANPDINFTDMTPSNNSVQGVNGIYINVSSNDSSEHYTFLDFDRDVLLWMRMDVVEGEPYVETDDTEDAGRTEGFCFYSSGADDAYDEDWSSFVGGESDCVVFVDYIIPFGVTGVINEIKTRTPLGSSVSVNCLDNGGTYVEIAQISNPFTSGPVIKRVPIPQECIGNAGDTLSVRYDLLGTGGNPGMYEEQMIWSISVNRIVDESSYSNDGIFFEGASQDEGYWGKGFEFDGVGGDIRVPGLDNGEFLGGEFTVSAWINTGTDGVIASDYILDVSSIPQRIFGWSFEVYGGYLAFREDDSYISASGVSVDDGEWHHVTASLDSVNVNFYLDGEILDIKPRASVGESSNREFVIGAMRALGGPFDSGYTKYFNGLIDEVMLFNRTLKYEEIQSLYSASENQYDPFFDSLSEETHFITAYAVDKWGNRNETELRQFHVSSGILIEECGELNEPNTIYILQEDIDDWAGICFTITADNVTLDGQGNYISGGTFGVRANSKRNLTVKNLNILNFDYGIYFVEVNDSLILDNYLEVYPAYGIHFEGNNNNITGNTVVGSGVVLDNAGLRLMPTSANNFIGGNEIIGPFVYGIFLQGESSDDSDPINNNDMINNVIRDVKYGVFIYLSANNTLSGGIIDNSGIISCSPGCAAIGISNSLADANRFIDVSVTNTDPGGQDIIILGEIDGTQLIDMYLERYDFTSLDGSIIFESTEFGKIEFLEAVSGSGENLSDDVRIGDNFAVVESDNNEGLNRVANVTLYGIGDRGFENPKVLRNGHLCPEEICYNFTDLDEETVVFNVSYWTNYSIGEGGFFPIVELQSPVDGADLIDRTPDFNWLVNDLNGDTTQDIEFEITCHHELGGSCDGAPNGPDDFLVLFTLREIGGITECSDGTYDYCYEMASAECEDEYCYTLERELQYFVGDNYYYAWTARARDEVDWGEWAGAWRFNLMVNVDILVWDTPMSFESLAVEESADTTVDIPLPFLLENLGNVYVNVDIDASDLWESLGFGNPTENYQFKVDIDAISDDSINSFDFEGSITEFTNLPSEGNAILAIANLNYTDITDTVETDIKITVPPQETPGEKSSTITFYASRV